MNEHILKYLHTHAHNASRILLKQTAHRIRGNFANLQLALPSQCSVVPGFHSVQANCNYQFLVLSETYQESRSGIS